MIAAPRIRISWLGAFALCASAGGVLSASAEDAPSTAAANARVKSPVLEQAPTAASQVLARFDGGEITAAELEAVALNQPPQRRAALRTAEGRLALLQDLITYELLVREAERRGYARDLAVLDARRSAAIEIMLQPIAGADSDARPAGAQAQAPQATPEQAREALVAELRKLHPPRVRAELITAVVLDPIGARDQPQGFQPAPNDPRLAPRHVEPDGM